MKTTARHSAPLFITVFVLFFVTVLFMVGQSTKENAEGSVRVDIFDRFECITYDARMRMAAAANKSSTTAASLATMFIDNQAIELVNDNVYGGYMAPAWDDSNTEGMGFKVPWPRFMYGQIVRELSAQGAKAVAFDILFSELDRKSPETAVPVDGTNYLSSDEFFAQEIEHAGNVILATEEDLLPQPIFAEPAAAIGNIKSQNDYGVLRRVRAFGEYKVWNPKIVQIAKALNLRMSKADTNVAGFIRIPFKPTLENPKPGAFKIPLLPSGNLMLTQDGELNTDRNLSDVGPDNEPPFTLKKAWSLGIVMAAMQLGIDLDRAIINSDSLVFTAKDGTQRVIPTDKEHRFYIDWSLRNEDIQAGRTPVLFGYPLRELTHDFERHHTTNNIENEFKDRLVVVGSIATGNNLTDRGSTPLEEATPLVTKHLNVANSVLTNRFVRTMSDWQIIALIWALGGVSGLITWRGKVMHATVAVAICAALFLIGAFFLFIQSRFWLPIIMPVFGGLLLPHFCLVTYRVLFEQKEQRHLKGVFTKLVAPEVVNELLSKEKLSLGGARRELTVYFADVRGFTEFTDRAQKEAEAYVKRHNLSGKEAEAHYDKQAEETLTTVNLYLSTIADQIKKHKGTLDKYIGDCVMAFWGAPLEEAKHAVCAVRCAIDAQRAMYAVNMKRAQENERRKAENIVRAERGEEPLALLPVLQLGSGINTGSSTVGLMGSTDHIFSYTVFGVEVNLASRLEGVSGRGRIIVSQRTYEQVKAVDSELAATFIEQPAVTVKGISTPVRIYEVPWKQAEPAAATSAAPASVSTTAGAPEIAAKA